jgi:hypothetical protein
MSVISTCGYAIKPAVLASVYATYSDASHFSTFALVHMKKATNGRLFRFPQTPTGFPRSTSILYNLIALAASFPVIFPSRASASIAACAM